MAREENVPEAYRIGDIPFLGLTIGLASRPLIPRPETEWWTEELIIHLKHLVQQSARTNIHVLDMCAGSGAIGLAVLKHCPDVHVSLGEISKEHGEQIRKNLALNGLDASRADIRVGDLFRPFRDKRFDVIAANPPYVPMGRTLPESVVDYEPHEALFAGSDGLAVIRRILADAPQHLVEGGTVWMECDCENIHVAQTLARAFGAREAEIRPDQYKRPRLLVIHY